LYPLIIKLLPHIGAFGVFYEMFKKITEPEGSHGNPQIYTTDRQKYRKAGDASQNMIPWHAGYLKWKEIENCRIRKASLTLSCPSLLKGTIGTHPFSPEAGHKNLGRSLFPPLRLSLARGKKCHTAIPRRI
jgi:hypothetical protein